MNRDEALPDLTWGPDPERAQKLAEALLEELGSDAPRRRLLTRLCAHAPFLAPRIRQHPEWFESAVASDLSSPVGAVALGDALSEALRTGDDPAATLRQYKYRALLRITLRELSPEWLPEERGEETLLELSELAAVLLDAALGIADETGSSGDAIFGGTPASFCVLGLGKLGAAELNYSSDVDLIYLHSEVAANATNPRGDTAGEHFGRLARRLGPLVANTGDDGFLYRVDLDLRPEGAQGPLVISEGALARYYEARADTWERATFAKARPVAGDLALGWRALGAVAPSIYRSTMDYATVQGIRELKQRVVAERGAGEHAFDVKRDPGGIRDIEFVAQALQLLHGARIPQLRDPSTLGALERLEGVGLLPAEEALALRSAYRFLRRLENRLQMRDEAQVHVLDTDDAGISFWARSLECSDAVFRDALAEHRRAAEDAAARIAPEHESAAVVELLTRHQPKLVALPSSRVLMEQLAADLSREIAASADPELALNNLDRFVAGVGGRRFYYELLLDRPELITRLCALFASSRFLSNLLAQYPRLIEPVFDDPGALLLDQGALRSDLASLEREQSTDPDDFEAVLRTLRLFVHRHTLNVGMLDLSDTVQRDEVERALSDLAEVTLGAALESAERQLRSRRPGALDDASFLVVGMGKLGSRELGYGSDLDLIFLFDIDDTSPVALAEAQDYFVRLIQRLISALQTQTGEGRCYEIDARLRPSGGQGSLVCSAQAFARYHAAESQAWERQALLRARPVAGSDALAATFEAMRREILERVPEPDLATQIHHLRERMERELAHEQAGHRDFKTGRGGLLDVESAVQYLQLLHGGQYEDLLRADRIEEQIERLADLGVLDPDLARALGEGFAFLQHLSAVLRIAENRSISDLDTERGDLDRLGRRMGYRPEVRERDVRRALLRDYTRHTEAIRSAYLEILRPGEDTENAP